MENGTFHCLLFLSASPTSYGGQDSDRSWSRSPITTGFVVKRSNDPFNSILLFTLYHIFTLYIVRKKIKEN